MAKKTAESGAFTLPQAGEIVDGLEVLATRLEIYAPSVPPALTDAAKSLDWQVSLCAGGLLAAGDGWQLVGALENESDRPLSDALADASVALESVRSWPPAAGELMPHDRLRRAAAAIRQVDCPAPSAGEPPHDASWRSNGERADVKDDAPASGNGQASREPQSLPQVNLTLNQVRYADVCHDVTADGALLFNNLVESYPQAFSASTLFTKPSRVKESLPDALKALIVAETGKGYRLNLA